MKTTGKQEGQVLVFVALAIIVLLGITGLAIDGGIAYGVRAKLSSAVDAAALAAANATGDSSGGYAAAITAGTARFKANYPAGYLKSTVTSGPAISVAANTPKAGYITVNVTASATAPTYFMQVLGLNKVNASSTAQAVKSDLDMVFVIDNTGSLDRGGGNNSDLKAAAVSFINRFNPATDRVGLIKFAYGATVVVPIKTSGRGFDKNSIVNAINAMSFTGDTDFDEAFWDARAQLDSIPLPSSHRVIVFFSDGSPNSFSATFNGSHPGIICSYDTDNTGDPFGLEKIGVVAGASANYDISKISSLPAYATWTNGGPSANTYQVAPNQPAGTGMAGRPVRANYMSYSLNGHKGFEDVNNAARNLPEEMAHDARASGIYVYTLGLDGGPDKYLTTAKSWGNREKGNAILMNMADDTDAPNYGPDPHAGLYAYAADDSELQAAFDEIASALLRLTK